MSTNKWLVLKAPRSTVSRAPTCLDDDFQPCVRLLASKRRALESVLLVTLVPPEGTACSAMTLPSTPIPPSSSSNAATASACSAPSEVVDLNSASFVLA